MSGDSLMTKCALMLQFSTVQATQVLTPRLSPPLPIGLGAEAATWNGDAGQFAEITKLKIYYTEANILAIPLTGCLYHRNGAGSWAGLSVQGCEAQTRSEEAHRTLAGKAEWPGVSQSAAMSTDECSGVWLLPDWKPNPAVPIRVAL